MQFWQSDADRVPSGAKYFGFSSSSAYHVPRTADDDDRSRRSAHFQTGIASGLQFDIRHFRH